MLLQERAGCRAGGSQGALTECAPSRSVVETRCMKTPHRKRAWMGLSQAEGAVGAKVMSLDRRSRWKVPKEGTRPQVNFNIQL